MKAKIVRIGNSQGIRIPKPLLEETGLAGEVEIQVRNSTLVIAPAKKKKPRAGWAAACRKMSQRGDDKLLDPELISATTFDEEEWEW